MLNVYIRPKSFTKYLLYLETQQWLKLIYQGYFELDQLSNHIFIHNIGIFMTVIYTAVHMNSLYFIYCKVIYNHKL